MVRLFFFLQQINKIQNIARIKTPPIAIPTTAPVEIPGELLLEEDGVAGEGLEETLLGGGGDGVSRPGGGVFLEVGGGGDGVEPDGGDGGDGVEPDGGDGGIGVVEGGGVVVGGSGGEMEGGDGVVVLGGGGDDTGVGVGVG